MVVVNFLVEFSDENVVTVPVGISDSRSEKGHAPLVDFVKRLREKCGIKGNVELRNKDGSKVVFETWNPEKSPFLYALANEEASRIALEYRETMRRTIRSNSRIGMSDQEVSSSTSNNNNHGGAAATFPTSASSSNTAPISQNQFIKVETTTNGTQSDKTGVFVAGGNNKNDSASSSSRVEVLDDDDELTQKYLAAAASNFNETNDNNNDNNNNKKKEQTTTNSSDEDDDDYDTRGGEHLDAAEAIHFISHGENKGTTSVSKVAAEFGSIICHELPQLSPMYPSSLVDTIRRDPRMKAWIHLLNKKSKFIEKLETALPGMPSDEYSHLLYIAKRRGHILPVKNDEETQVAFYSYIDTLTHSCAPSAMLRFKKKGNDPNNCVAILRCIQWGGFTAGDLLSTALPKVCQMDFFILPTSRRRKYLQEQYSLKEECHCARCTNRLSMAQVEVEESLTGAFFLPKGTVSTRGQTRLVEKMKKEFEEMKIMAKVSVHSDEPLVLNRDAKNGKITPSVAGKLYDFLKKYTHELVLPKSTIAPSSSKVASNEATATANDDDDGDSPSRDQQPQQQLKLHQNHWRLSLCRIALLAFLFPPTTCSKVPKIGDETRKIFSDNSIPTRHPTLKLDQLVVRHALAQLEVESAVIAKHAKCAHPVLKRSYVVFRYILACLPEQLSSQVQRDARNLPSVDWPMIEKIAQDVAL